MFPQLTRVWVQVHGLTPRRSETRGVCADGAASIQPVSSNPKFNFFVKSDDRATTALRKALHRKPEPFPPSRAPWSSVQTFGDFFPSVQNSHCVPHMLFYGQPPKPVLSCPFTHERRMATVVVPCDQNHSIGEVEHPRNGRRRLLSVRD